MRKWLIVAWGCLVLLLVNGAIFQKERLLRRGSIVLLELAPVDPRSLMQGDYMRLRYRLENELREQPELQGDEARTADGYLRVRVDDQGVATMLEVLHQPPATVAAGERVLRYRVRQGELMLASNAYFFPEGQAEHYQPARYGEFRVDDNGDMLLTGLRDEGLKPL